uniref:J domain-containing protein n=1 Tax=Paramoeba aestuarina TaxID=180227 RepID=A0A7S4KFN5_9EUKA|mmetsp:Transcript_18445/g.28872  ORF Transcript_18445/g.28872 Transcript_18445/m.28872 type:complete len:157 (+) Transcript_18445:31-501(+)
MSVDVGKIIDHISKSTNHFDTLGLSAQKETCTTKDVIKAYRKLAARIHPDKCTDPRAKDVFDKVNQASKILSNEAVLKKLQAKFSQTAEERDENQSRAAEAHRANVHAQILRKQKEREERKAAKEIERANLKRQNEEIMVNQKKWKAHQQNMIKKS